jgi:hypothetical protein
MDLKEIEAEVDSLESRIERLRALYDQYFMGLEKMEPGTLRAEIDRKLWQLRKLRIQNTGVRYRFQMLIQRYNTYQQYWQRVMREMERGIYMRDILRAAKRIGNTEALTILGKRRARMFKDLATAQEARKQRRIAEAGAVSSAEPPRGEHAEPDDAETIERARPDAAESERATAPAPARAEAGPAAPGGGLGSGGGLEDPTTWNLFDEGSGPGALGALPAPSEPPAIEQDLPTLPPPSLPSSAGDARRLSLPASPPLPAIAENDGPTARSDQEAPGRRPIPPPRAAVLPPRPAPSAAREPERADAKMREVFAQYVDAKRRGNEPTDGLTYDKLRRSLDRQAEQLRSKHGNREIDFEVITQDGRTRIRPVVR